MSSTPSRTRRLLIVTLAIAGAACQGPARNPPAPSSTSPNEAIEQAAWLAGHWKGDGLGGVNETLWSPPAAGTMMGVYRHIKDGRVVFYEFLTLSPRGDSLILALKHFNPDMTGWEERTRSVEFPLLRAEADALYFEGMTYRRTNRDEREVTVLLGADADNLRPELFTYRRVRP